MKSIELKARVLAAKKRIKDCDIKQVFPIFKALHPNTDQGRFTAVFACQMVDEQITDQLEQIAETIEKRFKAAR